MSAETSSNYTSLLEDIQNLTVLQNSTSPEMSKNSDEIFLVTEFPFPSPADPFEDLDLFNGSDYKITAIRNGTDTVTVFEYLNISPWLMYSLCGIIVLIVLGAIIGLVCWIKKNKTRVINETTDPVLAMTFPGSGCFSCCSKSEPKSGMDQRQNSSSNLEFYGRPALPQSAYVVERPKSQESMTIATSNHAMYIDGIEDIPNREIPQGQQRALPKYRYQQYQTSE
ncbi:hypothetical protein L5515_009755 [Caenorhabditis briggsae]|uniref:Uncharacterized protein n=1 Tax=Caenorhabditis briggsae TaxID=6238 RepID=A0AAE9JQF5_CAEBR|nr:hypothetical protein L5515_009755 [Caenorhabditis briggsae]